MIQINVKPLSVNEAWRGRREKSVEYLRYAPVVLSLLPPLEIPEPPFLIHYEFGVNTVLSDYDNLVKPFQDLIVKKYGFDDRYIFEATIKKVIVPKGQEYIKFSLETLIHKQEYETFLSQYRKSQRRRVAKSRKSGTITGEEYRKYIQSKSKRTNRKSGI